MDQHEDHSNSASETGESMPFSQKAARLLEHWIHHNNEHAQNYQNWAAKFRKHDLPAVAALLEAAAELTGQINMTLRQAARQVPPGDR